MTDPSERATTLFSQGYNCAQSVLASFAEQVGLEQVQALRLASTLGGGVSRRGEVCGAVTGALLALGLAKGSDVPAGKESAYQLGQDFLRRFESVHGTILCRELIDCDLSTPEGRTQARSRAVFTALCPLFVHDAVELARKVMAERS